MKVYYKSLSREKGWSHGVMQLRRITKGQLAAFSGNLLNEHMTETMKEKHSVRKRNGKNNERTRIHDTCE